MNNIERAITEGNEKTQEEISDMIATLFAREYWRRRLLSIIFSLVWSALFAASVAALVCFWSVCFPIVFRRVLKLLSFLFLPMYACVRWTEEGTLFFSVVVAVVCPPLFAFEL